MEKLDSSDPSKNIGAGFEVLFKDGKILQPQGTIYKENAADLNITATANTGTTTLDVEFPNIIKDGWKLRIKKTIKDGASMSVEQIKTALAGAKFNVTFYTEQPGWAKTPAVPGATPSYVWYKGDVSIDVMDNDGYINIFEGMPGATDKGIDANGTYYCFISEEQTAGSDKIGIGFEVVFQGGQVKETKPTIYKENAEGLDISVNVTPEKIIEVGLSNIISDDFKLRINKVPIDSEGNELNIADPEVAAILGKARFYVTLYDMTTWNSGKKYPLATTSNLQINETGYIIVNKNDIKGEIKAGKYYLEIVEKLDKDNPNSDVIYAIFEVEFDSSGTIKTAKLANLTGGQQTGREINKVWNKIDFAINVEATNGVDTANNTLNIRFPNVISDDFKLIIHKVIVDGKGNEVDIATNPEILEALQKARFYTILYKQSDWKNNARYTVVSNAPALTINSEGNIVVTKDNIEGEIKAGTYYLEIVEKLDKDDLIYAIFEVEFDASGTITKAELAKALGDKKTGKEINKVWHSIDFVIDVAEAPDPATNTLNIRFENPQVELFKLKLYKTILNRAEEKIDFDYDMMKDAEFNINIYDHDPQQGGGYTKVGEDPSDPKRATIYASLDVDGKFIPNQSVYTGENSISDIMEHWLWKELKPNQPYYINVAELVFPEGVNPGARGTPASGWLRVMFNDMGQLVKDNGTNNGTKFLRQGSQLSSLGIGFGDVDIDTVNNEISVEFKNKLNDKWKINILKTGEDGKTPISGAVFDVIYSIDHDGLQGGSYSESTKTGYSTNIISDCFITTTTYIELVVAESTTPVGYVEPNATVDLLYLTVQLSRDGTPEVVRRPAVGDNALTKCFAGYVIDEDTNTISIIIRNIPILEPPDAPSDIYLEGCIWEDEYLMTKQGEEADGQKGPGKNNVRETVPTDLKHIEVAVYKIVGGTEQLMARVLSPIWTQGNLELVEREGTYKYYLSESEKQDILDKGSVSYKVVFTYDGLRYETTKYNVEAGEENNKAIEDNRDVFNNKYKVITNERQKEIAGAETHSTTATATHTSTPYTRDTTITFVAKTYSHDVLTPTITYATTWTDIAPILREKWDKGAIEVGGTWKSNLLGDVLVEEFQTTSNDEKLYENTYQTKNKYYYTRTTYTRIAPRKDGDNNDVYNYSSATADIGWIYPNNTTPTDSGKYKDESYSTVSHGAGVSVYNEGTIEYSYVNTADDKKEVFIDQGTTSGTKNHMKYAFSSNGTVTSLLTGESRYQDSYKNGYNDGIKTTYTRRTDYDKVRNHHHINLGLIIRHPLQFQVRKDLDSATVDINGKHYDYKYGAKFNELQDIPFGAPTYTELYNDNVGMNPDAAGLTEYPLNISESDYNFKFNDPEWNDKPGGHSQSDELEVTITYKLLIRNISQDPGTIYEIADFYDSGLELKEIKGANGVHDTSEFDREHNATTYTGYNKFYIRPDEKEIASGETMVFYVTFKVKKDPGSRKLLWGMGDTLKDNCFEIIAYGNELGQIDVEWQDTFIGKFKWRSIPGNYNPETETSSPLAESAAEKNIPTEYDAARAPSIRLVDNSETRVVCGNVWEDFNRNGHIDRTRPISGVEVYLVEIKGITEVKLWGAINTDTNGDYAFSNQTYRFISGDYVVRFRYGNEASITGGRTSADGYGSAVLWSGQDFETTIWDGNKTYEDGSHAKDLQSRRDDVIAYGQDIDNQKARILALMDGNKAALANATYMHADTKPFPIEVKIKQSASEYEQLVKDSPEPPILTANEKVLTYNNMGLVERKEFSLYLTKLIENSQLSLAGGSAEANGSIKTTNNGTLALHQLDIDELLNGATLKTTYNIGVVASDPLTNLEIADYLDNDTSFNKDVNSNWNQTEVASSRGVKIGNDAVITEKYMALNQVIKLGDTETGYVNTKYVLTKPISSSSDSLTYDNYAEVAVYGNLQGRRMYGMIPGNKSGFEDDENDGGDYVTVAIIPPLGQSNAIYYILAITSVAIFGVGIVLIKKYVIKK